MWDTFARPFETVLRPKGVRLLQEEDFAKPRLIFILNSDVASGGRWSLMRNPPLASLFCFGEIWMGMRLNIVFSYMAS